MEVTIKQVMLQGLAPDVLEINMSASDSVESFPAMLRRVLGKRLRHAGTFSDMFAVDGVLEYPFAPPGLNTPIVGRDAIIANFQRIRKLLRIDGVADVFEIEVSDPDIVVLEFTGRGEGLLTKEVCEPDGNSFDDERSTWAQCGSWSSSFRGVGA